jgi:hypothetical protein
MAVRTRRCHAICIKSVNHEMALERFSSSRAPRERAYLSLRFVTREKCPPIGGEIPKDKNYCSINNLTGWGAWIRTRGWRNQNPTNSFEVSKRILKFRPKLPVAASKASQCVQNGKASPCSANCRGPALKNRAKLCAMFPRPLIEPHRFGEYRRRLAPLFGIFWACPTRVIHASRAFWTISENGQREIN